MNTNYDERMNAVSDLIKDSEKKFLADLLTQEASYGSLKWEWDRKKITMAGRPLMEFPFAERAAHISDIPGLYKEVHKAMSKALEVVKDIEKIREELGL
jgi:hypothetical protein